MNLIKYYIQNNILVIEFNVNSFDLSCISKCNQNFENIYKEINIDKIIKTIIDLNNIKYIDFAGIGMLLKIKKQLNMEVYIKNATSNVLNALKLASLDSIFIFD